MPWDNDIIDPCISHSITSESWYHSKLEEQGEAAFADHWFKCLKSTLCGSSPQHSCEQFWIWIILNIIWNKGLTIFRFYLIISNNQAQILVFFHSVFLFSLSSSSVRWEWACMRVQAVVTDWVLWEWGDRWNNCTHMGRKTRDLVGSCGAVGAIKKQTEIRAVYSE